MMHRKTSSLLACFLVLAIGTLSWPIPGILHSSAMAARLTRENHVQNAFAAADPSTCSQQQIIRSLLKPGILEIWNTGSSSVSVNTHFDSSRYPVTIPYGRPIFTGASLDPHSLTMGRNTTTGYYFINFSMKKAEAAALISFSSHNIGHYITITLNRVVVSSPQLRYTLPGKGQFQMSPHALTLLNINCEKP